MNKRAKRIYSLMLDYVAKPGISGTPSERTVESFQEAFAKGVPYFNEHPEHWGFYPIEGDPLGRHVFWLLKKGEGEKTVVLIHHSDVVEVSDYGSLEAMAFSPEELGESLLQRVDTLEPAFADIVRGGEFLFGRGTADMKGGGATQLALLEEYCEEEDFSGNVLVLAVPDEENLSAGMRAGLHLLDELHEKFSLDYTFLINSESHQPTDGKRTIHLGTVGKLLYFVYVKGRIAHVGKEWEGFSPMGLLGKIMAESEQRPIFLETAGEGEITPSPVWVYARDNKQHYDVSMVTGAFACMNLLFFQKELTELSFIMENFLTETFTDYTQQLKKSLQDAGVERGRSWEPEVLSFSDFSKEVSDADWKSKKEQLEEKVLLGEINYVEATRQLMEHMMKGRKKETPLVVFGLIPPYYPGVCSAQEPLVTSLLEELEGVIGEPFATEHFFTGISDLSYTRAERAEEAVAAMTSLMPFFGKSYTIAFDIMERWQIPGVNIGPLGLELHKKEERVHREDLLVETPKIIDHAVRFVLK